MSRAVSNKVILKVGGSNVIHLVTTIQAVAAKDNKGLGSLERIKYATKYRIAEYNLITTAFYQGI